MGNLPATDRFIYHLNDGFGAAYGPDETNPNPEGRSLAVVYVKGDTVAVKLKFHNNNTMANPEGFIGALNVMTAKYIEDIVGPPTPGGGNPTEYPLAISLSGPLDIPQGGDAEVTVTFGPLPPHVSRGKISFTARAEGNFGAQTPGEPAIPWSGGGPLNQMFVVYAQPKDSQQVVWVDVLALYCGFGMGAETLTDVVELSTRGLFKGKVFKYNLDQESISSYYYRQFNGGTIHKYRLNALLAAKNVELYMLPIATTITPESGNCYDVNTFLLVGLHALGINANLLKTVENSTDGFITNYVCPIGWDGTNTNYYVRVLFGAHCQVITLGNKVSDAALSYDKDLANELFRLPASLWDGSLSIYGRYSFQSFPAGVGNLPTGLAYRQFDEAGGDRIGTHVGMEINVVVPNTEITLTPYNGEDDSTLQLTVPFLEGS